MIKHDELDTHTLARQYPSIASVTRAIKNFEAELSLPKATEHFVSDLHGEYDSFCHAVKSGSGAIALAVEKTFAKQLNPAQQHQLTALICYPQEVLAQKRDGVGSQTLASEASLVNLVMIARYFSEQYARSKVQKILPGDFTHIIEQLLCEPLIESSLSVGCKNIIENLLSSGRARKFIIALAELIQKLAVSRLHVVGDIYDRGPGAHHIIDMLMEHHSVDVQWGNHDILWMGAAAGSEACIATAIRIALRYTDLDTLQSGYGINLLPLAGLAVELYGDDPCLQFQPKVSAEQTLVSHDRRLFAQMQKTIALIQLKLEGQIVQRRPQYQMNDRLLLDKIDHDAGTVTIDNIAYSLIDTNFPTISADAPYMLTEAEQSLMAQLTLAFTDSKKLQQHVRFLYSHGAMYHVGNGHLLYHGCVAMNEDGSFKSFNVDGKQFVGKAFADRVDKLARQGYFSPVGSVEKSYGQDAMWYLWCGEQSPLFGKKKMATFERYFVADKTVHSEGHNAYYRLRNSAESAKKILLEFGVDPIKGRIVNGHVPVKVKKGESPIKADGKLLVIDGGFAKAYRGSTGIGGYTLMASAESLSLLAHKPFESVEAFIRQTPQDDLDIECIETMKPALKVKDCDERIEIDKAIINLTKLLQAYQSGQLAQE